MQHKDTPENKQQLDLFFETNHVLRQKPYKQRQTMDSYRSAKRQARENLDWQNERDCLGY
jgi:coproporphyrinogen III oxidase-like Fe-S oxidoreductase